MWLAIYFHYAVHILNLFYPSNQYSNYISSKPLTATPGSRHFHWCLWCFFPTAEDIRVARARLLEYQGTARQRHQGSVFGQISREPRASPRFLRFGGLQAYFLGLKTFIFCMGFGGPKKEVCTCFGRSISLIYASKLLQFHGLHWNLCLFFSVKIQGWWKTKGRLIMGI